MPAKGKEMTIKMSDRDMDKLALIRKSTNYIGCDEELIELLLGDALRAKANACAERN